MWCNEDWPKPKFSVVIRLSILQNDKVSVNTKRKWMYFVTIMKSKAQESSAILAELAIVRPFGPAWHGIWHFFIQMLNMNTYQIYKWQMMYARMYGTSHLETGGNFNYNQVGIRETVSIL